MDGLIGAALGASVVAIALARASRTPYTVDSVLFALATERFDLMALRPHPPGYPVFVALGKALLPMVGGDVNGAFVLQSALWSGLAIVLLYHLLRAWGGRRPALAGALLFATAPVFAFNGTIALSYTAEAAAVLAVGLLAWQTSNRPTVPRLLALGATWGLAVGIRQSLFLFLAPVVGLALVGLPLRRLRRPAWGPLLRRTTWTAGSSLLLALAWLVPMTRASGGLAEVRRATRLQSTEVVFADAVWVRGWPALVEHIERLAYFLHWEARLLLPVTSLLILAGWLVGRSGRARIVPGPWPTSVPLFALAWLGPATLFYLLVFNGWERGPLGYVLTLLPGLYALLVLGADHGVRRIASSLPPVAARALAVLALPLLLVPLPGLVVDGHELIQSEVAAHDDWARRWQQLDAEYPAHSTAILVWQSWAHVKWSFPDHLAWTYFPTYQVEGKTDWALVFAMQHREDEGRFIEMYQQGPGRPPHPIPDHVNTIVLFDFQLAGEGGAVRRLHPDLAVHEAHLADGWRILLVHPDERFPTVESLFAPEALGHGARATLPNSP